MKSYECTKPKPVTCKNSLGHYFTSMTKWNFNIISGYIFKQLIRDQQEIYRF